MKLLNKELKETRKAIYPILAAVAVSPVFAQDETEDVDIFTLSPFTIESSGDEGYRASSTLSGSRLKTGLKDVAASVSILTEQFLEDTNSTNLEELLIYAGNAEVYGGSGNFLGFSGAGSSAGVSVPAQVEGAQNRLNRVRGLAGADLTRDFFETQIPMDAYNTDRVEVNRGANSILFGTGSPAGVINNSLKKAFMEDRNFVELQAGSEGSVRSVIDVQRVLADDKLAIRLIGLYDHTKYRQDPAFDRDERLFGAITYQPFDNTTIRANIETGAIESNPETPIGPVDGFSAWWSTGQETFNTFDEAANGEKYNSTGRSSQPGAFWQLGGLLDSATGEEILVGTQFFRPAFIVDDSSDNIGFFSTGRPENTPEARAANRFRSHIVDLDVFDFSKQLLVGDFARNNESFEAYEVAFEQRFLDGKAGIELVYNEQSLSRLFSTPWDENADGTRIKIDITEVLPDGRPNPNIGRPFTNIKSDGHLIDRSFTDENLRATAYYRLPLNEKIDGKLGDILGEHTFTGLYSESKSEGFGSRWASFWEGGGETSGSDVERNLNASGTGFRLRSNQLVYFGPSLIGSSGPTDLQITPLQFDPRAVNRQTTAMMWDRNSQQWVETQLSAVQRPLNAGLDADEIESSAFIIQSRMLGGNLNTVAGWRTDDIKSWDDTQPRDALNVIDIDRIELIQPANEDSGDTFTLSGVLSWPQQWIDLPWGSDLRVHYVDSENFRPFTANRVNIFGENLGAETGETEEFGFMVSLFEDKFNVRVNWYETRISNGNLTVPSGNPVNRLQIFVNNFAEDVELDTGRVTLAQAQEFYDSVFTPFMVQDHNFVLSTNPAGATVIDSYSPGSYEDTEDSLTKGMEIDLAWNVTENWRLMFNAAKQEATRSNIAPAMTRYFNELVLPVLEGPLGDLPSTPPSTAAAGDPVIRDQQQIVDRISQFNTAKAAEGTLSQELREWRWNLITNYTFAEGGTLGGFNVGGGLRWQDDVAIGYPLVPVETGSTFLVGDLSNPHLGDSELNTDLWIGYRSKIWNDSVDWKIQLNVRNAFADEGEVIPVSANPDGSAQVARFTPPTRWTLSSSFEF